MRWLLPWLIVWLLCGVALANWLVLIDRVDVLGRIAAPMAQARTEIALERAFSGRNISTAQLVVLRQSQSGNGPSTWMPLLPDASAMRVDGASFHLNLDALGDNTARASALTGTVSWRYAQPDGGATQLWVCGHAQPPTGAVLTEAQNLTNIAPELLPSTCRVSR